MFMHVYSLFSIGESLFVLFTIFASLNISNSASDEATVNESVLNIESHSTINSANEYERDVLLAQHGFKNSQFYEECMGSLTLLPPRDFAVFERQFLLEYYTQRGINFTMY